MTLVHTINSLQLHINYLVNVAEKLINVGEYLLYFKILSPLNVDRVTISLIKFNRDANSAIITCVCTTVAQEIFLFLKFQFV